MCVCWVGRLLCHLEGVSLTVNSHSSPNSHPVFCRLFRLFHSTQHTMKVSPYLDRSSLVVQLCFPRLSLPGFCCLISAHPRTDRSPLLLPTQIWSMKKDSEAAAKKKPKVNAAQLRVQKGTSSLTLLQSHISLSGSCRTFATVACSPLPDPLSLTLSTAVAFVMG